MPPRGVKARTFSDVFSNVLDGRPTYMADAASSSRTQSLDVEPNALDIVSDDDEMNDVFEHVALGTAAAPETGVLAGTCAQTESQPRSALPLRLWRRPSVSTRSSNRSRSSSLSDEDLSDLVTGLTW